MSVDQSVLTDESADVEVTTGGTCYSGSIVHRGEAGRPELSFRRLTPGPRRPSAPVWLTSAAPAIPSDRRSVLSLRQCASSAMRGRATFPPCQACSSRLPHPGKRVQADIPVYVIRDRALSHGAVSSAPQGAFARRPVATRNAGIQSVRNTVEGSGMPHVVLSEVAAAIDIQTGAVVSRVIFHDDRTEVTVFGFDAGEGLSEHQASRSAIVQVVKGRLEFIADGEQLDAGPGFWLHMEPGTPHSLTASEPTVMLLTLIDAG